VVLVEFWKSPDPGRFGNHHEIRNIEGITNLEEQQAKRQNKQPLHKSHSVSLFSPNSPRSKIVPSLCLFPGLSESSFPSLCLPLCDHPLSLASRDLRRL